jgi:hypothetical protein
MDRKGLQSTAAGFQASSVLLAANHLGITAVLVDEALAPAEVAERLNLDPRAVRVVCEALHCLGVLERDGNVLRVTETLREALDPGSRASLVHILRHQWFLLQRWVHLDRVVTSGGPVPRPANDTERREAFILAMADLARMSGRALWDAVDLHGRTLLVDVGGGPGELAIAALERFPGLRAVVFDLPPVLEIARGYAERRGVGGRLALHPGDVLEDEIPPCDVALVSALVHSYGVEDTRRIAAHVAAGVAPGGLVVVREFLWDDAEHSGPVTASLFAVNMLVGTRAGRCWTAAELEEVFGAAGFADWRLIRLDPRSSVLVGVRR